jgi:site-specific DNA-methyltransferase (adenine-specific)
VTVPATFLDGRVTLHAGHCREAVSTIADASIDSVVCDPPYALVSIVKRFGGANAAPAQHGADGAYARASAGFMGKQWDTGETAFAVAFWADVLRVLKPGGHVVAFGGTRTYHRLAVAIEDAGFEIRDQLAWTYGTGFPKSHNAGNGWGTALKPAWEPIVLARKPLDGTVAGNVLRHGTGAINIDGCRVEMSDADREAIDSSTYIGSPASAAIGKFASEGSDKPMAAHALGRFPANIVHDGSDEVLAAFPAARSAGHYPSDSTARNGVTSFGGPQGALYADSGSAARFFYAAKADGDDRLGSKHPTVKPVDLMRWLVRLVTPKRGVVLDPFAGTGTTGEAAWREGFSAILCEREPDYQADIARRMALCLAGPATRRAETAKARGRASAASPLFDLLGEGAL